VATKNSERYYLDLKDGGGSVVENGREGTVVVSRSAVGAD